MEKAKPTLKTLFLMVAVDAGLVKKKWGKYDITAFEKFWNAAVDIQEHHFTKMLHNECEGCRYKKAFLEEGRNECANCGTNSCADDR